MLQTYQNTLHDLLDNLMTSLRDNRSRQRQLQQEINDLEAGRRVLVDGAPDDLMPPPHLDPKAGLFLFMPSLLHF